MPEIKNTAPLIKDGKKLTRRFLGNLFPINVLEKNELKAYLKGSPNYQYKGNGDVQIGRGALCAPIMGYKVRQEYFYN